LPVPGRRASKKLRATTNYKAASRESTTAVGCRHGSWRQRVERPLPPGKEGGEEEEEEEEKGRMEEVGASKKQWAANYEAASRESSTSGVGDGHASGPSHQGT